MFSRCSTEMNQTVVPCKPRTIILEHSRKGTANISRCLTSSIFSARTALFSFFSESVHAKYHPKTCHHLEYNIFHVTVLHKAHQSYRRARTPIGMHFDFRFITERLAAPEYDCRLAGIHEHLLENRTFCIEKRFPRDFLSELRLFPFAVHTLQKSGRACTECRDAPSAFGRLPLLALHWYLLLHYTKVGNYYSRHCTSHQFVRSRATRNTTASKFILFRN